MAASSVNATNAQLKIGSAVTPSTATLDASGTKLVLIPTGLPALPGTVSVSLTGLTDKAGNVLATFNSSFAAPDWQQPGIQPLDINLAKNAETSSRSLALDSSGKPVMAWNEYDGTSNNIYVKRWDGTAWQQVGATFLDANTNKDAFSPSIALDSSGKPVVAWRETDNTSYNIYVKRWDGTAWQQVGATFLDANTNQSASFPSIALDSSGKPVVAWSETDGTSFNIYVKRWDGTAWQQVGATFLDVNTNKSVGSPSMALDSSGKPVVAWGESDGTSDNIYVKRWDGTTWQQVGATFLDANTNKYAREPSIALDSSGQLVVAWSESDGTSNNIYVKRWDGTTWQQVGATFLDANTNKSAYEPSIALDSSGKPIVAWDEADGTSDNIYVKRWDGTTWQQVGATFLDANTNKYARDPAIALDSSGKPVVAWTEDDSTSNNIYVKRLNRIP